MINPKCDICGEGLDDYGGLLFSPPDSDQKTVKSHICKKCYGEMEKKLK
jgi:hypothetical protein|tara:strand:+ start:2169 stop:2315 length:147 start_codon:yes stop_codon:yes gene_type:complete